ncbi:MAG: hypothetical protein K8F36_05870 [Melioribacteraceae bacterium]|nr:hypothetical protein [Melioribacteraceae bacterium]
MKIEKQYIIQAVTIAANNLRLSSEKIEVVSLFKKHLNNCEDIESEISRMKKITELSKLAVKLGRLIEYIKSDHIDFLRLTETFKEQSHTLTIELSNMLDFVTPAKFKEITNKLSEQEIPVQLKQNVQREEALDKIQEKVEVSENSILNKEEKSKITKEQLDQIERKKQEFLFEDLEKEEEFDFENYEKTILAPVKKLEDLLKRFPQKEFLEEEVDDFMEKMLFNSNFSYKVGFDIIGKMHKIIASALLAIKNDEIASSEDTAEGIRACLIVIVAVVRGKEVDISNYLKKAEKFSKIVLKEN